MKQLYAFLVLATVVALAAAGLWTDCSSSDDKSRATIQSITINPDPPEKNHDLTIKAQFTLKENVTDGAKAAVTAKLDGIKLYSGTFDLCDVVKQINLKCPLYGPQDITVQTKIPNIAPKGHYTGSAKAYDQNGKEIACIDLDGHLG